MAAQSSLYEEKLEEALEAIKTESYGRLQDHDCTDAATPSYSLWFDYICGELKLHVIVVDGGHAWRVSGWFGGEHHDCFGRGSTALEALRDM